jgi:hypothetical protein
MVMQVRPRGRHLGSVVDALLPFQEQARSNHRSMWQYGDIDTDDEL